MGARSLTRTRLATGSATAMTTAQTSGFQVRLLGNLQLKYIRKILVNQIFPK